MDTSQASSFSRCSTPSGSASLATHVLGPHPLIQHYLKRLNVDGILRSQLPQGKEGLLTHGEAICILIHNILTSAGPLYRLENWIQPIEAHGLGLSPEQKKSVNDDRIARALDAMSTPRARGIWFRLALRQIKEWKLNVERVHFDTTSITLFGEYKSSVNEPRMAHGHNKDHRPDLKQLIFGLNVTNDEAVPLLHKVWSGNRTDDGLHVSNFDRLRGLLGTVDFIYVADSKLATTENMGHIATFHGKFVTVLPRSRKEDQAFRTHLRKQGVRWKTVWKFLNQRREDDPPNVYSCPVGVDEKTAEGYRLTWFRSSDKANRDAAARKHSLEKVRLELDDLALKLDYPRKTPTKRGTITSKINAIFKRYDCRGFFKIGLRRNDILIPHRVRPGRPRKDDPIRMEVRHSWTLTFDLDDEALKAEQRTDGVFPLVSYGVDEYSRKEILEVYKYQPYLEKRFSQIKTDLSIAPVYLKTPLRVVALIDVYFIAIAVASLIERDLRKAMARTGTSRLPLYPERRMTAAPTAPLILEAFASVGWHEFRRGAETIGFPLVLSQLQKTLLRLLDVPTGLFR